MAAPASRFFLAAAALVTGVTVALGIRHAEDASDPDNQPTVRSGGVEVAARRFLVFVLLPIWVVPGFGDYWCHRAANIERTSGTHESLTHLCMIATTGVGVVAGLFFEVNALALAIMTGAALAHEGVVLWDVGYAARLRPPNATEQHFHSFLEVLPFAGLAFTCCLHPDALAALAGKRSHPSDWRLRRKAQIPWRYDLALIATIATLVVVPHVEEFIRCYRVDRTLAPHRLPIDEGGKPA